MVYRLAKRAELSGRRFGKWEVLGRDKAAKRTKWLCRCSCGSEKSIFACSLTSGRSTMCRSCAATGKKVVEMSGQSFGEWSVIRRGENTKTGQATWVCICSCGLEAQVIGTDLRNGKSTKCLHCHKHTTKHGLSHTKFYKVWAAMLQRCRNPNYAGFKGYGDRGITVCPEWSDFTNFRDDMLESYDKHKEAHQNNTSIERENNNKGYSKANCIWATRSEQSRNTRKSKPFKATSPQGEVFFVNHSIADFADNHGLNRAQIALVLNGHDKSYMGWHFCYLHISLAISI